MNQYEFYSNFFKYRGRKEDLQHASTYGDYYYKIENYYGPGKSRYFKDKDEYDAYVDAQEKQYNKTKEELTQNKINKFTSGRDAAIQNSNNNYKAINAENERLKYEGNAKADRAKKEKEEAQRKATTPTEYTRRKFLEANLSSREAAINKSAEKTKEAMIEQKKMKNPVYAAMKSVQKKIKRAENFNEQNASKQKAIDNSEKISDEEWKARLKADEEYQKLAKMPGGKAMADAIVVKKTALNNAKNEIVKNANEEIENENAATNIKTATENDKEKEEAAKKELRKIQLEELNDNAKQFEEVLQKLKRGGDTLTKSQIQSLKRNPLYQALNQSLSDDESFDIIDFVDVGGMWGNKRIEMMEKSLDELVKTLEKSINNGTMSNTGTVKTASKEQPRPGRGAI